MSDYEPFDPTRADELAEVAFAATPDITPEEPSIEALGGLTDSHDEVAALLAARQQVEDALMAPLADLMAASAEAASAEAVSAEDEEPYDPGNVVGVGIGEKYTRGVPTGRLAVKVLVKEKRPQNQISSDALASGVLKDVPTDVEETGEIYAHMFTARRRPAPCGVSIGNCGQVMAGTLGCLVTRQGQLFILSNNHVIALVNTSPLNAGIPQPGRLDAGVCDADVIGRLSRFIPISFAPGANNLVDAAIARTSPNLVDRRILRPGGVLQPIAPGIVPPAFNLSVQKSGRTTQYRRGVVDLVSTTVTVNYAPTGGVARFINQFRVRGVGGAIFSDRGDSGSLVTTFPQNQPVGLLFAGNAATNTTFCNPIGTVLSALGVTIVT